ncbi:aminoglycoside phosphotransferase family protein [Legionella maioricensis]|uniref:Aminoglycoside 3'-phosphotransferase/choline kinase family protein n=1 Tax=Legionella maioricensis TaxID=2896528 RepID=A0A9X2D1R4_9GAMM|nr:aminoglycoside 3'-phosphotransferase/choline kinase family protein [Legionella maioricensis]MCL9684896.1 aminoglycoside 3'-phosphotransferase/choline kinase family protein [Legionella maioricensis]MCL9688272.1 aminoglycoside 3'-phosphotransferase/choline kinase family protein [Legionella maioricensis]
MNNTTLKQTLSTIHTFENYEQHKQRIEEDLAKAIIRKHQLPEASLMLFSEGTNIVFSYGDSKVIKIFPPFHQNQFENERLVLKHVEGKLSIKTPALEYEGEIFGWPYLIISKLEGTLLEVLWETMAHNNKMVILRELGALIREVQTLPTNGLEAIDCYWPQFIEKQIAYCIENHQKKELATALLQQLPAYLDSIREILPEIKKTVLLTGEYTPMNFLVKQVDGVWHISGLIDFGDAMLGLPQYDLLGPGAFLIQGDKQLLHTFLLAYGYLPQELTNKLSHQLTALMLLHQYSNLNVQIRIPNWQDRVRSLKDLENLVWGF